eukprot:7378737-Prymnesium_polylepis.1
MGRPSEVDLSFSCLTSSLILRFTADSSVGTEATWLPQYRPNGTFGLLRSLGDLNSASWLFSAETLLKSKKSRKECASSSIGGVRGVGLGHSRRRPAAVSPSARTPLMPRPAYVSEQTLSLLRDLIMSEIAEGRYDSKLHARVVHDNMEEL